VHPVRVFPSGLPGGPIVLEGFSPELETIVDLNLGQPKNGSNGAKSCLNREK
jgi:hypothetical protein